jgi:hypothetical protein
MERPSSPHPRACGRSSFIGLGVASAAALVLVVVSAGFGSDPVHEAASVEALSALPAAEPAAIEPEATATPRYAQQLGTTCRTATRICPLPAAQPIGAPCTCDGEPGEVAP